MITRKRAGIFVTGAVALALVTTGCGDDDSGSKAKDDKATGSQTTGGTGGGTTGGGTGGDTQNAAAAVVAAVNKVQGSNSVKVTMDQTLPGMGTMKTTGAMRFGDDFAMRLTMSGGPLAGQPGAPDTMEMLMTSKAMYMNMGEEMAAETGGKSWLKFDLEALASMDKNGQGAAAVEMMKKSMGQQQDPTAQLALMKESGDIRQAGEETVDGVKATHYTGTVDLAKAAATSAEQLGLTKEALEAMKSANEQLGVTTSTMDVWIDSKTNLPVKQAIKMKTTQGEITTTVKYSDWGTKVDVTPPPASETADLMEMLKDLQGLGG